MHEREDAVVGDIPNRLVPGDALDLGIHGDRSLAGVNDAADEAELVSDADRLLEIDPIHGRHHRPAVDELLGMNRRQLKRAMDQISAEDLLRHVLLLRIDRLPGAGDEIAHAESVEERLFLLRVQPEQHLELLPRGRLQQRFLDGTIVPALLQRVLHFQRRERAVARHHREVARGDVVLVLLHANAHFHRCAADIVQTRSEVEVAVHVGGPPNPDAVNGCGDDSDVGKKLPYVCKRSLFRQLVEQLEREAEAKIALDRLVGDHEAPAQGRLR